MALTAAIIVPTRLRVGYLDHALASIMSQAASAGAEVVVVDDGPSSGARAAAERHGARYVAHRSSRGLNAARNTGLDAAGAVDLLCFVDDDIEAEAGWLRALMSAAETCPPEVGVLTGPIRARFEDHRLRLCGREGPPITAMDLGPHDVDAHYAWGANLCVRADAFARAGRFDESRPLYGDEQEWQDRLRAAGGRVRYVAAAGVVHRRAGDDARLRSLSRAAFQRGRASRDYDAFRGRAPGIARELRVLGGCLVHTARFACANGIVMVAHSAGRVREAAVPRPAPAQIATPGIDDFLSGASGTVGGRRGGLLTVRDRLEDLRALPARVRVDRAAERAAERTTTAGPAPRPRVLVIGIERPEVENRMAAARAELHATDHHDLTIRTARAGTRGKFENLNALLEEHGGAHGFDWLLVVDDDVDLPRGFLDRFLFLAGVAGLRLAQPAQRLHSHAAWAITRRCRGALVRETNFVEIGPVTAFHHDTFPTLLPFPALRMGWGLDVHWSAVARAHGWPIGIVDATPIGHTLRPAAETYPRAEAVAEARAFLAGKPYVSRGEVGTLGVLSSARRGRRGGGARSGAPR